MLSAGMFAARAASIATRRRALPSGLPPPFFRLICFHLLWPATTASGNTVKSSAPLYFAAMRTPLVALLLAASVAALPGCKSEGRPPGSAAPPRPQLLADIPRLDRSILTDTTGAEDAERATHVVQVPLDSVARVSRRPL